MWDVCILQMTLIPEKVTGSNGKKYYGPVDEKCVNGKIVRKYAGYIGKSPKSRNEIIHHLRL